MKWFPAALALLAPLSSIAGPPFNYTSATNWTDETTKSDVPKAQRVYVFGPEKITETYVLNDKPAKRDVAVRRILRHQDKVTLGALLANLPEAPGDWRVTVHRRGDGATATLNVAYVDGVKSKFALEPLDAIEISAPKRGLIL
jgi:hypothetical protein